MKVRNVPNTADLKPTCGCDSWLAHWRAATGSTKKLCSYAYCSKAIAHGAHVRPVGTRETWIVGLCADCNHPSNAEEIQLDAFCELAPTYRTSGCPRR